MPAFKVIREIIDNPMSTSVEHEVLGVMGIVTSETPRTLDILRIRGVRYKVTRVERIYGANNIEGQPEVFVSDAR